MEIHNLTQGSAKWHAYRRDHWNASDAPAMLGCSIYKTRNHLIRELASGLTADVSQATQAIFDNGHRYEALARPLAESIIGEALYPVVGSDGKYSASFDGLTLSEEDGFEHKSLNDELRALMGPGCEGHELPKMYRVQMEQQIMVSKAKRILFMASTWIGDQLGEHYYCWYYPDLSLQEEIAAGWIRLEADVAAYVPPQYAEKPVPESLDTLPAIAVQIEGRVIASNLPAFKERLAAFVAGINTCLTTDQDFANAEAAVKSCADTEKRIAATKEQVLGQVASIDEVIRALDDADAQLSKVRINLEKQIKAQKELIKAGILSKVQEAFQRHVAGLEAEIVPLRLSFQERDFAGAMKNKRTLESLQNAVDTELAAGKIAVDAIAASVRARLTWWKVEAAGFETLFADLQTIIQKGDDDFKLLVQSRITAQKQADEAKLEAERQHLAQVAVTIPAPQVEIAPEPINIPAVGNIEQAPPSLRLGEICTRLGFTVNAEFLASLGFVATLDKGAKLYRESDFKSICSALQRHISSVSVKY